MNETQYRVGMVFATVGKFCVWLPPAMLLGVLVAGLMPPPHRPAPLPRPIPDADILFIGDSSTWGWTFWGSSSWASFPAAQNLGLPSYRASHLLADAHRLRGSDARVVVAHIGAADVSTGAEPEAIATDILHALEAVHEAMPDARILVLELVPRRDQVMGLRTDAVNMWLRDGLDPAVWDEWTLDYATWVPLDVEPGADGVHLGASGYAELASVLAPMVRP